jgi:hypothetical protein
MFGGMLSHCFPLTRDNRNPYCFGVDELGMTENIPASLRIKIVIKICLFHTHT